MRQDRWKLTAFLMMSLIFLPSQSRAAAPTITSLSITTGAVGASVTITGTNFGATPGTSTVKFNGTTATVTSANWTSTVITTTVPSGATSGNVIVTVSGVASNAKAFTVVAAPSVTSLTPANGAIGASVTIAGANFGATQGTSTVKFNGTAATVTAANWTATSLHTTVPTGAISGNIVVHASGVDSATNANTIFTVLPTPTITSLSITTGAVGASVTINGSNFGSSQGTSTVKFNGTTATVTAPNWTATAITTTVPTGATSGSVVVTVSGVASAGSTFTVVAAPSITSLTPTTGAVGVSVTIAGTGFGSTQGASTVKFNGTTATVTAANWTATSIKTTVPTGTTTGNVVVHASGVDSAGKLFTVPAIPTIATVSPNSGAIGTTVVVTGTNFGSSQGTSTIKFNGTTATVAAGNWTATSITTTVPTGATSGNVVVTVSGVASAGSSFSVLPAPTIGTVAPTSGAVGSSVNITGTNFGSTQANITVSFNGTNAVATLNSSTSMTATVPTGATTGNVVVAVSSISSNGKPFTVTPGSFNTTGSLNLARSGQTATLLTNGMVLIAGGLNSTNLETISAELYNPSTGTFSSTGNLNVARSGHSATLLSNGMVLIAGGSYYDPNTFTSVFPAGAELYNPATGTFTMTGNLNSVRALHAAIQLTNGFVLISGGYAVPSGIVDVAAAELYNPSTGVFTPTGSLNIPRETLTATLLNDGRVLIAGGVNDAGLSAGPAELYDPNTAMFTLTGGLGTARYNHTATLLNDGRVLVTGGINNATGARLSSSESFSPGTGTFTATGSLTTARTSHTATLLNNGTVLVTGGFNGTTFADGQIYDPVLGVFSPTSSMVVSRASHSATLLGNGKILIAGGSSSSSAELYSPTSLIPAGLVSISIAPANPSVTLLTALKLTATGTFADSSTQTLASANWSSSNSSIATVTNDSASHGQAFGAALGSPIVTACAGTVCGSTTVTVITQPSPSIANLSPSVGPIGTQVTITGTAFGSTQGAGTVTFNGVPATVNIWGTNAITATVPVGATTGNIVVTVFAGSQSLPSNGASFGVSPDIASLNPVSGPVNNPVTITGLSFGSPQPGSTITFNGVVATPTSWTDTSIVVPVPVGATTGSVVVTVANLASNSENFIVTAAVPPTITASLSPAPNSNGWNNSNVTVSYTCTPGGLPIVSCPAAQTITTEGASQLVTGTVMDTAGDIASTSVTINLDKTRPLLAITSPDDSSSVSVSVTTLTGSVSDSLSGSASLTCNGSPASVASGSFTCTVGLSNVGANLIILRATDRAGNLAGVNFHVSYFGGTQPPPNSLQITPGNATMLVGDTQKFTAVDDLSQQRFDATWIVSDSTIASITSDSSPLLTALAVGQVTLTATVGTRSAQITVNISGGAVMPAGTVRWTAPPIAPGAAFESVLQAAPVQGAPDLFSFERQVHADGNADCYVGAFTANGQQLWTHAVLGNAPPSMQPVGVADATGGLIVLTKELGTVGPFMTSIDGQTGNTIWAILTDYDTQDPLGPNIAVGQEGRIYFRNGIHSALITLDGATGVQIGRYDAPILPGSGVSSISDPVVGPDGTVYALVFQYDEHGDAADLSLFQMSPGGSTTLSLLQNQVPEPFVSKTIPDGQSGVYFGLQSNSTSYVSHAGPSGYSSTVVSVLPDEMVLDENGVLYAMGHSDTFLLMALAGGNSPLWSYQAPSNDTLHLEVALAGSGGVIVLDQQQGLLQFDSSGTLGLPSGTSFVSAAPYAGQPTPPFSIVSPLGLGNWVGSAQSSLSMIEGSTAGTSTAVSPSPYRGGNPQKQAAPPKPRVAHFIPVIAGALGMDPSTAVKQIKEQLPEPAVAYHRSFVTSAATVESFLDTVAKPLSAVAFIGHTVDIIDRRTTPNTLYSIGMSFWDHVLVLPPNANLPFPVPTVTNSVITTQIKTQARVVFIGACYIGDDFKSLWSINDSTTNQALIALANPGDNVILGHAIVEWTRILEDMILQRLTVRIAVTNANAALLQQGTDMQGNPITEQWAVIGGTGTNGNGLKIN